MLDKHYHRSFNLASSSSRITVFSAFFKSIAMQTSSRSLLSG